MGVYSGWEELYGFMTFDSSQLSGIRQSDLVINNTFRVRQ